MRIDMGKRVKRFQDDRPSVGEVMDDRVIAREVAMVASCFLCLWECVRVSECVGTYLVPAWADH
jgi:hypothetical protein